MGKRSPTASAVKPEVEQGEAHINYCKVIIDQNHDTHFEEREHKEGRLACLGGQGRHSRGHGISADV